MRIPDAGAKPPLRKRAPSEGRHPRLRDHSSKTAPLPRGSWNCAAHDDVAALLPLHQDKQMKFYNYLILGILLPGGGKRLSIGAHRQHDYHSPGTYQDRAASHLEALPAVEGTVQLRLLRPRGRRGAGHGLPARSRSQSALNPLESKKTRLHAVETSQLVNGPGRGQRLRQLRVEGR